MATLSSPTLQSLITSVRRLLNQQDPNDSFWQDTELTDYLNEAVRIYFIECVLANEGPFLAQTDLDLVANSETVALPPDCFEVRSVYKKVSSGYSILPYNNSVTSGYSTQGGSSNESYTPYYYFRGNNLVFKPVTNFSEVGGIRLEYIQFPDNMVWGGDSMTTQVSPVFKQLIEMYAVYKAKLRESMTNGTQTYAAAQSHLGELHSLFKSVVQKRSKYPTYTVPFNPEVF